MYIIKRLKPILPANYNQDLAVIKKHSGSWSNLAFGNNNLVIWIFLNFRLGTQPPDMSSPCVVEGDSYNNSFNTHHHHPVVGRSGQILWIRGLTRLQTQVRRNIGVYVGAVGVQTIMHAAFARNFKKSNAGFAHVLL